MNPVQLWFMGRLVLLRMMIVGEFRFLRNVIRCHLALPVSAERECVHHRTVSHHLLRTGCVAPKPTVVRDPR